MEINFKVKKTKDNNFNTIELKIDDKKDFGKFTIIDKNNYNFYLGNKTKTTKETYRRIANKIFEFLQDHEIENINIILKENVIEFLEGFILSDYKFDKYISKKQKTKLKKINIITSKDYTKELKELKTITKNINIVRDLINENSNVLTPDKFVQLTKEYFKNTSVKIEIFDEKRLLKENLNLIHTVGKGSINKPRFVLLKYMPNENDKIYSLVGKGVTYDTGGYYLKPFPGMNEMKGDMAGAATILGAFKSLVELNTKKNIIVGLPLAENSVDGQAYKPGDVYESYSKQTVEIVHTDAEGRLILADAISYIDTKYKPELIIDMATLTGAMIIALGDNLIGMFCDKKNKYTKILFESGEQTGEQVWELPIYEEHKEQLQSSIADIKNLGTDNKSAGSIVAGAFLMSFVKNSKLIHLDIAAAALNNKPYYYWPSLGTGKGVRLLVDFFNKI
ncbi:MAG: leucyl aminopeptidase family protein [Nanoarchaeota archaeon]